MNNTKIKKAVIREDLLSITSDFREAIILNQFIYWSERIADADTLIEKENEIAKNNGEEERNPFYGWIYKTSEDLAEEVMLGLSATQIRRYVKNLVNYGYLLQRNNPKYKWDRTLQYKVNLVNIARALKSNGYSLSEYKIDLSDDDTNIHVCTMEEECMQHQNNSCELAIPETTTDNTNIDYNTEKDKTLSSDNAKVKSSLSERKQMQSQKSPKQRFLDKKAEEIDMLQRLCNICESNYDEPIANEILTTLEHYFMRFTEKTGLIHPILKDETLYDITYKMSTYCDEEYKHFERLIEYEGDFARIVDEFFREDYGQKSGERTNWNLPHFMSDGVLNRLAQRLWVKGEVG